MITWLDRKEYPFVSKYMDMDGPKMHYIDEGSGEVIVFVHGTPSWSFDFRHIIKALSGQYRCIAPDHIGFGLSDKPAGYDYSPHQHVRNLERLINELNLSNITLVMHDFGGPIGFQYAIRHASNIKRLIVFNSWLRDSSADPDYLKLRKVLKSPLLPLLYKYLNFSARYLLPRSFGSKKPAKHVHRQYLMPFRKISEREGSLAFARSLRDDQAWFGKLWHARTQLTDKPILFVWGMKDTFVTPLYLEHFVSGFSNHTVVKLPHCGHFPQEEEPAESVAAMSAFLKKT